MGRKKLDREYSFKPTVKIFAPYAPLQKNKYEEITLLQEEIEAIFLMDFLNLYQEDAAKKMNISRPTFSRILKNARNKVASSIINGKKLIIDDQKRNYIVATCTNNREIFDNKSPKEKFIALIIIEDEEVKSIEFLENPAYKEESKPGKILPKLLKEKNVNFFISQNIGEGLKNNLLNRGIFCIESEIENINSLPSLLNK